MPFFYLHALKIPPMTRKMLFIFIIIFPLLIYAQHFNSEGQIHEISLLNDNNCNIEIIAHRGYSDIYPENTLLSIEEAFKRGVKYCEIDVNVTSDDVYVLFHDQPTMFRTSNGQGYVVASTYAELKLLDVGSWKGSQFTGLTIPTLEEALLLAEKYDGYLYLDTKKFRPDLMGKALKTTGVNPKRLMPAIASVEEAVNFKTYCPDSPFIYFGKLPEQPEDDQWYTSLINLGCEIFETYYTYALDNDEHFQTFVSKVHQHGAKVWVFTSNDIAEIKKIKAAGVDGVETDLAFLAKKAVCDESLLNIRINKTTTANWNFSKKNLQSTGIGSQLKPFSYHTPEQIQQLKFGKTSDFNIKSINGVDADVIKVPPFNTQNGLFVFTNFTPGIHEELHYDYSLIMDLYIPLKSKDKFISLIQTNPENLNDGDLFISSKGIGINNNYHGVLNTETWYRIALTFSSTAIKKYINGKFVGATPIEGGRWSVINTFPGGDDQGFLLFADDNKETAELYVSAIQLRNYTMNSDEILNLGNPKANGIPINNTGIYNVKFEDEIKPSIVNFHSNEILVTFQKETDLSNITGYFTLPYRANATITSGSKFDLRTVQTIEVTSEDKSQKTLWKIKTEYH